MQIDNSYGKTRLCKNFQEAESHIQRRLPTSIINAVMEEGATVHWQGMKMLRLLEPQNSRDDVVTRVKNANVYELDKLINSSHD